MDFLQDWKALRHDCRGKCLSSETDFFFLLESTEGARWADGFCLACWGAGVIWRVGSGSGYKEGEQTFWCGMGGSEVVIHNLDHQKLLGLISTSVIEKRFDFKSRWPTIPIHYRPRLGKEGLCPLLPVAREYSCLVHTAVLVHSLREIQSKLSPLGMCCKGLSQTWLMAYWRQG